MLAPPGGENWMVDDTLFNLIVKLSDQNGLCSNLYFNNNELNYRLGCIIDGVVEELTVRGITGEVCIQDTVYLDGEIHSYTDVETGIGNVDVRLFKNGLLQQNEITEIDGRYDFENVLTGLNYNIFPIKDTAYLNGVSSFDLSLVHNYNLGLSTLNPYQIIAADVNCDDEINFQDELLINNLILGIDSTFEFCYSWDFIPTSFVFEDSLNPFPFPRSIQYDTLIENKIDQDFIGIKKGDLDEDVIYNKSHSGTMQLIANVNKIGADDYELSFRSPNFENLIAYQMGFVFDQTKFDFDKIKSKDLLGVDEEHFATKGNSIRTNWVSLSGEEKNKSIEDILFSFPFKAKENISDIRNYFTLDDKSIKCYAYDKRGNPRKIELVFENTFSIVASNYTAEKESYRLYQNEPNPFVSYANIGFDLPKAMTAQIRIYNVMGQTVKNIEANFNEGYNEIKIDRGELAFGIYYYELNTENFKATKVMKTEKY